MERTFRACDRAPTDALATGPIEGALDDIGAAIVSARAGVRPRAAARHGSGGRDGSS